MASFAVDSNGKRIETNILVSGYIRNVGKEYKLLIPQDINSVCFDYWLIKVCDEWDTKYAPENEINGQIIQLKRERLLSVYGKQSVNEGSYLWQIRFNTDIEWFCVGVIVDDEDILDTYRNSNFYDKRWMFFIYKWRVFS